MSTFRVNDIQLVTPPPAPDVTFRVQDITVEVTQPLSANAGEDQSECAPGLPVTLDGSLSTGEGTLIFDWAQTASAPSGVTVTLSSTASQTPTFTAPQLDTGVLLTFTLRVQDDTATWSATDTVQVAVDPQQHWRAVGGVWVPAATVLL